MSEGKPAEPKPPQEQPPTGSQSLGKRVLAAIMFTDAVAFSAKMNANEEHTLAITARDLATITDIVRRFEGRVVKRTGDGLLAFFSSGVQSVACALEIQHTMAEQAKILPPGDVLQHRIGIHLGDVFLSRNEVMGDGVNIAARLQTEAPAGGICITQALYEIAKNRLSLHTVHLGARQLKNIRESVQVYQILTESDEVRVASGGGPLVIAPQEPAAAPEPKPVAAPAKSRRKVVAMAAGLVLIAAAVAAGILTNGFGLLGGAPPAPSSDTSLLDAATRKEYEAALARLIPVRDYEGIATWIKERGLDALDSPLRTDYVKYKRLGVLLGWLEGELRGYRSSSPLAVRGRMGTFSVYGSDGRITLRTPGGERPFSARTESAALVLNVAVTAARERWRGQPMEAGDPRTRLVEGMALFARENDLRAADFLAGFARVDEFAAGDLDDELFDPFVLFDRDGNGRLALEEIPPALRAKLQPADANKDGLITRAEYVAFRRAAPGKP